MFALLLLFLSLLASRVCSDPIIKVGDTDIVGRYTRTLQSSEIEFFGGIPFAKPPLGQLRLSHPVLLSTFDVKNLNAKDFGPGCLQTLSPSPPSGVSEDCLTLNVYRPSGISSESRLPVLVWIYGGAFNVGASSFYNATELVMSSATRGTPILFVSINYRLGPLGFPQGNEAAQKNILNLGLHDQLTALEWIQQNIHNFGGDNTKVTVGGESAGATSITIHLLESRITKLARAVIMESLAYVPAYNPDKHEASWQQYVAAIPACASTSRTNNTLDCLRGLPDSTALEQALITTQVGFANISFQPVIDGPGGVLVDRPSQITQKGNLPVLLGSNLDEGTLFASQSTASMAEIQDEITGLAMPLIVSPQKSAQIIKGVFELYPDVPALGSPFGTGNDIFGLSSQYKRLAAILGDFLFQSGRRAFSQQTSEAGFPVFAYYFTDHDAVAFGEFAPSSVAPNSLGVPHTSEMPYVFGRLMNKTPNAMALSAMMQNYWISFVNGLDPNDNHGQKRPNWEPYAPNNKVLMELNGKNVSLILDNYRTGEISLWLDNPDFLHR